MLYCFVVKKTNSNTFKIKVLLLQFCLFLEKEIHSYKTIYLCVSGV